MNQCEPIGVACVGAGAWGRNQIRVFANLPGCRLRHIVDSAPAACEAMGRQYPQVRVSAELDPALDDPEVRAVVIASPAPTHFLMATTALKAGKDVFIEKPMVLEARDGLELVDLAESRHLLIQVGHLLLFHPVVRMLKSMLDEGRLGAVHYAYTQRLNLGTVRSDENALWSLAPHDISLLNYLFDAEPVAVTAGGGCFLRPEMEDVAFLNLKYPHSRLAHVHVSWLDPHKVRRLTVVGSQMMAVFDDMEPTEKLRIYDKGVNFDEYASFQESYGLRHGDIVIPSVPNTEPLRIQAEHFVDCVRKRTAPLVGGRAGLGVVQILQAADIALQANRRESRH